MLRQISFGTGRYEIIVPEETINKIAESVVYDTWGKLPHNARTPEVIQFAVKRAGELADSMLVAYLPGVEPEKDMR